MMRPPLELIFLDDEIVGIIVIMIIFYMPKSIMGAIIANDALSFGGGDDGPRFCLLCRLFWKQTRHPAGGEDGGESKA
jgi:hypothetical protein